MGFEMAECSTHVGPRACAMVAVAQLVVAPGCDPGGRGFKSPRSPQRIVGVGVGNDLYTVRSDRL